MRQPWCYAYSCGNLSLINRIKYALFANRYENQINVSTHIKLLSIYSYTKNMLTVRLSA